MSSSKNRCASLRKVKFLKVSGFSRWLWLAMRPCHRFLFCSSDSEITNYIICHQGWCHGYFYVSPCKGHVCPDYPLFLGVSVKMFLDDTSHWIRGLCRVGHLMWEGMIQFVEGLNGTKGGGGKNISLFTSLAELGHLTHLLSPWTGFWTWAVLHSWLSWVSSL